jgi:cell division protein FtsW (lipid II flippase)
MTRFRLWRHFDYVLFAVTFLLTAYGVLMIYSANLGSPDARLHDLWRRQALFGAGGMGLILLLAAIPRDYQWLGDFWWLAYLLAVVLLVLVLLFGQSEIGQVRGWFNLGLFPFQPSFLAMNLLAISAAGDGGGAPPSPRSSERPRRACWQRRPPAAPTSSAIWRRQV